MIDIDYLERLARAASQGPWCQGDSPRYFHEVAEAGTNPADRDFQAAASPAVVLELIVRTRKAERLAGTAIMPKPTSEPLFWYRPCGNDGLYEGPHHNNSPTGRLLRAERPDEWIPLHPHPPVAATKPEGE